MKYDTKILNIIESYEINPEDKITLLQDLGYDLEDILDICLEN